MIPKIAHLCWFGSEKPEWLSKILAAHKEHHPDWELKVWTEVPEDFPLAHRVKECEQYCQIADLLYIWALCEIGGVVFDTDVLVIRPMNELLGLEGFTTRHGLPRKEGGGDQRLTNGLMGSVPGGPFGDFYDRLKGNMDFGNSRAKFGPNGMTKAYDAGRLKVDVLPAHYFYPFTWAEKDLCKKFWGSDDKQRAWYLDQVSGRFKDGTWPYAVHLWHVFDTMFTKC